MGVGQSSLAGADICVSLYSCCQGRGGCRRPGRSTRRVFGSTTRVTRVSFTDMRNINNPALQPNTSCCFPTRATCFIKDTLVFGLHMRRECRESFPCHRGLVIPSCITTCAWRTCHDACRDHWLTVSVGGGQNFPRIPGACTTRKLAYPVRGPCNTTLISHYVVDLRKLGKWSNMIAILLKISGSKMLIDIGMQWIGGHRCVMMCPLAFS